MITSYFDDSATQCRIIVDKGNVNQKRLRTTTLSDIHIY